jgi:hypothetical protein
MKLCWFNFTVIIVTFRIVAVLIQREERKMGVMEEAAERAGIGAGWLVGA